MPKDTSRSVYLGLRFQSFESLPGKSGSKGQARWQEQELGAHIVNCRSAVEKRTGMECDSKHVKLASIPPTFLQAAPPTRRRVFKYLNLCGGHFSFKLLYMSALAECWISQPGSRTLPEPMTVR